MPPIEFTPVPSWPLLPHGHSFCGNANAVAVDSRDLVYVFNRGTVPVSIFDAEGNLCGGWGVGEFERPHGIFIDVDDNLWLVDVKGHTVEKRTPDGELLLRIGERGRPAPPWSGLPFNEPTDVAVHPVTRDVFVGDGYCNSHIHRYDAEGRLVKTWGGSGDKPGQLSNPHGLCLLGDTLVVCDRENYRLQFFSLDGDLLDVWHVFRPCAIRAAKDGSCVYVAELAPTNVAHYGKILNMGNRVSVRGPKGEHLAEFGRGEPGLEPDQFAAPHSVAIDSRGDVYVAEVTGIVYSILGIELPAYQEPVSMRKWRLVHDGPGSAALL